LPHYGREWKLRILPTALVRRVLFDQFSERTGTRILRSCATFHFVYAMGNIASLLEFGKVRGGIRRLTDTPRYPSFAKVNSVERTISLHEISGRVRSYNCAALAFGVKTWNHVN
jgi:hypothetical protein